jgi:hypothetical protein
MDEKFKINNVKPGDKDFVYDKRVDFTKNQAQVEDDSWVEGGKDDDYFDDDFV